MIIMAVTISTHNGSVAHRAHNIRDPRVVAKQEHIDPNGTHEVWRDEPPKQAYHRLFDKAVEEYNSRQTRSDRKIDDYYKQVAKSKTQHTVYEIIVAVGSKDNPVPYDTAKSILREYYEGWDKANPNMVLIGAYFHADERGVIHLHGDYIPIAHGYTRGMATRTGLDKALREQGFVKKGRETPQIQWQRQENARLERLCRERGIEVEHPSKAQEKALEHKETKLYQRSKDIDRLEQKVSIKEQEVQAQAKQLDKDLTDLRSFRNRPELLEPVKVGLSRKEYIPYNDYKQCHDIMCNALNQAERAESRVKQLSRQVTSQSKSLLERQVEAERLARQRAEEKAQSLEDRLQAKEGDRETAREQALNDVLSEHGVTDYRAIAQIKQEIADREQAYLREQREQEQQRQRQRQHPEKEFIPKGR